MNKKFCDKCLKEVNCEYKEMVVTEILSGKQVKYLKKYYTCLECGNDFYDDLIDYNIEAANTQLRKINNIITIDEIKEILEKYDIGKKPISVILGLGKITITRYLNGQNPTKENSDFLKEILVNPNLYELYLITNKDKITELAYKKSLGKTKQLELTSVHSKLYSVALYIIDKLEDITPLSLQKILYFSEGFSKRILNKELFDDTPEAWVYGPVYREIYESFSYYKYNNIDYSEILKDYDFRLDDKEKEYLDKIVLIFGCYSGKILREMSHTTTPWIDARKGLTDNVSSNRIIDRKAISEFFDDVCDTYSISSVDDIKKYSTYIFDKVQEENYNKL